MPKFKASRHITHNGKEYDAGKSIELDHEEAKSLIEAGAIVDPKLKDKDDETVTEPKA